MYSHLLMFKLTGHRPFKNIDTMTCQEVGCPIHTGSPPRSTKLECPLWALAKSWYPYIFLLSCLSWEHTTMWTIEEPNITQKDQIRANILSSSETIRCWHLVADVEHPSVLRSGRFKISELPALVGQHQHKKAWCHTQFP